MPLIPTDFFARLKDLYFKNANLKDYWAGEEAVLTQLIEQVAQQISFNYDLDSPLGVGGSGVVAVVQDKNLQTKRAVKVSRPSPGKERFLARVLHSETATLLRLSHPNLIRIFAQGVAVLGAEDYPYYVMEYVEGVQDSDIFLAAPGVTTEQILTIFKGVVDAVQYLHDQGTIHLDLKPANVLVTPSAMPIISDLGFAKQLKLDHGFTLIGGTEGFIHPNARKLVEEAKSDPNRLRGEALREALKPKWDLYSLGKTFLRWLNVLEENNSRVLSPYSKRYLRLLACRLLDGYNAMDERAIGLSLSTLREIAYESVGQVKTDIEKLSGAYNLEARIPELNLHVQDTIQAATASPTPFTQRVETLLNHPAVMRLGSCTQLGLLNLVYPTATHTRLEHSVGTFSIYCRYVLALYNDPLNPLFRQIMDEADLRAGLLAALLHDLGQYSLAHDLEEADYQTFFHEEFGYDILEDTDSTLNALIEREDGWNVSHRRVLSVLRADPLTLTDPLKDRVLHSLISGPVDADKIDYLVRDSTRLGLGYGKAIDLERLLRCLTIVSKEEDDQTYAALGIHEKGKVPAEAVGFARYAMFGQVYWHHAYRAIKAMIHRIVWEMLIGDESRSRASIRNEFRKFIIPDHLFKHSLTPTLFALDDVTQTSEVHQIHQGDLAVLNWLGDRSGPAGKEIAELLRSRNLFKRLLVLSREKIQDKRLWDETREFYKNNRRNWKAKLSLQKRFQKRIVELVENPPDAPPQTSIITPDAKNKFIVDGREKPIILVDFPRERTGDPGLEYVVEEDRRRYKVDELRTGSLEQSIVWSVLQANFHESIGKLRVFCHPDHVRFLSSFLSRQRIESELTDALHKTIAEA